MSARQTRVVIFGAGSRGREVLQGLGPDAVVVGFVDNNPARQYTTVAGKPVLPPEALATLEVDAVYVASAHVSTIRPQLVAQGIDPARIHLAPGLVEPGDAQIPAAAARANTLDHYLAEGYARIGGWLHRPALEATLLLADLQRAHLAPAPVCEIGVWEGRYLTLLSHLPATPQRVVAIDPLVHLTGRDDHYARLAANLAAYARRPDLVTLLERDSKTVTAAEALAALGAPCQFVSIDGDHTVAGVLNDLRLAEAITAPGGIVALDDVPNFACPGVTEAVVRHGLNDAHQLAPFLLVANKLFLTQRRYCEVYRRQLLARVAAGQAGDWGRRIASHRDEMRTLNVPVLFMGQELLVAA